MIKIAELRADYNMRERQIVWLAIQKKGWCYKLIGEELGVHRNVARHLCNKHKFKRPEDKYTGRSFRLPHMSSRRQERPTTDQA